MKQKLEQCRAGRMLYSRVLTLNPGPYLARRCRPGQELIRSVGISQRRFCGPNPNPNLT